MAAPRLIAFDVNETLLDMSALDTVFAEQFGDAGLRPQWFAQMLQVAFTGAITGRYVDFPSAQESALHMVAERTGVALPVGAVERVAGAMRALPAHADAEPALDRLRDAGHALVALGNSPLAVMRAQLQHADLAERFDALLSADEVRALKPRREAYALAARHAGIRLGEVLLVAAHSWDVAGALAAGCRAAFLARPGMPLDPLGARPELVAPDLGALADRILAG